VKLASRLWLSYTRQYAEHGLRTLLGTVVAVLIVLGIIGAAVGPQKPKGQPTAVTAPALPPSAPLSPSPTVTSLASTATARPAPKPPLPAQVSSPPARTAPPVPPASPIPVAPPARAQPTGCAASMTNSTPGDGGSDTVVVHTTAGTSVATIEHYKTTDNEHDGTANGSGTATITFSIGRPTRGYPVAVDVTTGSGQSCSTEFTPQ